MNNSIVPAHLAVKAMRDNGYKNAAYALAELMDNSIQHGATKVELLCSEIEVDLNLRTVNRIHQIAVLDNGSGMDEITLRMALQFGNGTHLSPENQKGIGKFGMGLPSSSISQAKKVEVWTWQNGIENAIYSYLDIDEITSKRQLEVPEPNIKPIPDIWKRTGKAYQNSGTLVIWSNIDRCIWKTAKAIIDNSELLIGRLYRRFLNNNRVSISMKSFKENNPGMILYSRDAKPNDPTYLMENSSCPAPFDQQAMFKQWGDSNEIEFTVNYNGIQDVIKVRFSYAKEEARTGYNAGSQPHGKHASKNVGVSLMRADRELDLDQTWVIQYDTRERWWGVEVEFPPSLDEVFGVTNNKQFANNFADLGKLDFDELLSGNKTIVQLKQELEEENDPKALLIDIANKIKNNLGALRKSIKAQATSLERSSGTGNTRHSNSPEVKATEITEERKESGIRGTSDEQESTESLEERMEKVEVTLQEEGLDNVQEVLESLFSQNIKYQFVNADIESQAFFTVKSRGGKIIISLNVNHSAYDHIVEVLNDDVDGNSEEDLKERLIHANNGLKLLLMAWARYEDEQPDGPHKNNAQDARTDWGRLARDFLLNNID